MSVSLTPEQQQVLDNGSRDLPRVLDPRTNTAYILVPESEYEAVRGLIEEDRRRQIIHESALSNAIGRMEDLP